MIDKMQPVKMNIDYLYHMTHISNLDSIFEYGLKSHGNKYVKIDISNKDVNKRREVNETIYRHKIHDYVPFYFNPRNAMMFVRKEEDIVILAFDKNLFLKNRDKKVIFTDRNASTEDVLFYKDLKDLDKLNWEYIKAESWGGEKDIKQKMMAEVLIYKEVEIKYLQKIFVKDEVMKKELLKKYWIKKNNFSDKIILKPYLFFERNYSPLLRKKLKN